MMAGRIEAFYGNRPNLKEFAPEGIIGELRRLHYDTANATSAPTMAAMKPAPTSQITYGTGYPYFGLGQFRNLEGVGLVRRRIGVHRQRECHTGSFRDFETRREGRRTENVPGTNRR